MNDSRFLELLTGRPAPRKLPETTAKPAPRVWRGPSGELLFANREGGERTISDLAEQLDRLERDRDRLTVRERLAAAESVARGRRKAARRGRRTRRVSEIDRNCTELDRWVRKALEKEIKAGLGESMRTGRRASRTARLRETCTLASRHICGCRQCIGGHR